MTELLEVRNLTTALRTDAGVFNPVDNVSITVRKGEIVALVGESGCGKSMTALSLMRLLPNAAQIHEQSSVVLEGRDLLKLSAGELRHARGRQLGMIFQDPMTFLNPVMRIGDQIAEAMIVHGTSRESARHQAFEALKRVRIPSPESVFHSYPHQLSGGMRQRVLIAIAVACKPSLLIADEPTTALDVTIQAQIMGLLHDLRTELGSAILLITHDLGLVAEYADRVYVMYAGQIVEEAEVGPLFQSPQHPYTRALLRSTMSIDKKVAEFRTIEGGPPNLAFLPGGCRFHPRCPERIGSCASRQPDLLGRENGSARCLLLESKA